MSYRTRVALFSILVGFATFLVGRDAFSQQSARKHPGDRKVQLKVGFVGSEVSGTNTVHRLAISLMNKTQTDAMDVRLTIHHSKSLVASTKWYQTPGTTDPQLTAWNIGKLPAGQVLQVFGDITTKSPIELEFVVETSDAKHDPLLIEIGSLGKDQAYQPFVAKNPFEKIIPSAVPVYQQKTPGTLP